MDSVQPGKSARLPAGLLLAFGVLWAGLAIEPWYRADWLLENVLVFVAVPLLVWAHRRLPFSRVAYACLFAFFALHEVGAHYTYAQVPYDRWASFVFGRSASDLLELERNHFDRVVHFLYGLLVAPAAVELLDAQAPQRGAWRWWLPWSFLVSHATVYELVEAVAAALFGGDLGMAYLGTQGDVWDAQKDSALAALGAAFGVTLCRWASRRRPDTCRETGG
jgi:putative membrane protein